MTDLHLSAGEVSAVRHVLMVDHPDYETRMLAMLHPLHRLVPSDSLGFGIGDAHGYLEMHVDLPGHVYDDPGPRVCDGPLRTGVEQLASSPYARQELEALAALGIRDCVRVGFALGGGRVAQIWFDRRRRSFEARHVQLLVMLQPALARLVRPPGQRADLAGLSGSESQVLDLVARGASNQEVADRLSVSESTVRKHLEHVYRKLRVTNRTAASALVHAGTGKEVSRIR
jgi:DNA-binding CsgD family transcriptional regulator